MWISLLLRMSIWLFESELCRWGERASFAAVLRSECAACFFKYLHNVYDLQGVIEVEYLILIHALPMFQFKVNYCASR